MHAIIISSSISFISGIGASIVAAIIVSKYTPWWHKLKISRSTRAILNFSEENDLLVVFAHRENQKQELMARMATEDALAINNIVEVLGKVGWSKRIHLRSAQNLRDSDKEKNMVVLGGPKVNRITAEILKQTRDRHSGLAPEFVQDEQDSNHWRIVRGAATYDSGSYEPSTEEMQDVAVTLKVTNPNNPRTKVLVLAGIRGIGTWAAADYLRKYIAKIYERKHGWHGFKKGGDFVAIVNGKYKDLDIFENKCQDFDNFS